jgi:predicted enzyme related to lactoylglutathione lyase
MGNQNSNISENRLARHGHVSYLEIPATDPAKSAAFYEAVSGWKISWNTKTSPSFDDLSGDLIGRFVPDRGTLRDPGIVPYIYVVGIDDAAARITKHGGEMVKAIYPEGDLFVARFRDPAGNVIGIWQFSPR